MLNQNSVKIYKRTKNVFSKKSITIRRENFFKSLKILYNKNNNSYETVVVKLVTLNIREFRMLSYRDTV